MWHLAPAWWKMRSSNAEARCPNFWLYVILFSFNHHPFMASVKNCDSLDNPNSIKFPPIMGQSSINLDDVHHFFAFGREFVNLSFMFLAFKLPQLDGLDLRIVFLSFLFFFSFWFLTLSSWLLLIFILWFQICVHLSSTFFLFFCLKL